MKKILIITTGGTIACETTDKGRTPTHSGEQLTVGITGCHITVCDLFSCDSTDIAPDKWRLLCRAVKEAKGFDGAVVSVNGDMADVVVCTDVLDDAKLAQIEDIVVRKTGIEATNIIISSMTE